MSYLKLNPPEKIAGVPILPLWGVLTTAVHDGNFYYKDKYTFPPISLPTPMAGTCSNDIVLVDIFIGDTYGNNVGNANRIATVVPVSGAFEFYLPKTNPGMIKLTAVGYDSLNEIKSTVRLEFLTTNWAILLWGFYVAVLRTNDEIDIILNPWLSQDKIRLQEILRDYLPLTKTPQVDWPTLESARAITRGALQALYGNAVTRKAILDYLKAWFGSIPILEDPYGWYLGGTDYRDQLSLPATPGASGSLSNIPVSYSVVSNKFNGLVSNSSVSVTSSTVTVVATSETYPGAFPEFEIDLLSTQFTDGDSVIVSDYQIDPYIVVWNTTTSYDYLEENLTEIIASRTSNSSNYWMYTGDISTTASNFVDAWNRTIAPTHRLVASYRGNFGRVLVTGTSKNPDDYNRKIVYKSGPYPELCPIKIHSPRLSSVCSGDSITVTAVATGSLYDYGSLFLAKSKPDYDGTQFGTISIYNDSLPFGQDETYVRVTEYWHLDSYTTTETLYGYQALQDASGDITGTAGMWYLSLSNPSQELLDVNGITGSNTFIPPNVVTLSLTKPNATDVYTIRTKRRPDREAQEALDISKSAIHPAIAVVEQKPPYPTLYTSDLSSFSPDEIEYESTLMYEVGGVWGRDKSTTLLADADCGTTSLYVGSGVFSVGDTITCGRDTVVISDIKKIQYVGDFITFSPTTLEKHYRGEPVYIPDSVSVPTLEIKTPLDMAYPAISGNPIPVNSGVYLDFLDNVFGNSERTVYITRSDSVSGGWISWEELPYPYQIRPAAIDPMCNPANTKVYEPWSPSFGASAYYTLEYDNSQPDGELGIGCMKVIGGSASNTIGVDKIFPKSVSLPGYVTFYAKGDGGGGTCYIEFDAKVPTSNSSVALDYSFPFPKPGTGWTKVTIDVSTIDELTRKSIQRIRFRSSSSGSLYLFGLFPGVVYRYWRVKFVIRNTRRRSDYILSRLGIHTFRGHDLNADLTLTASGGGA